MGSPHNGNLGPSGGPRENFGCPRENFGELFGPSVALLLIGTK